jgi:hypothetical protein
MHHVARATLPVALLLFFVGCGSAPEANDSNAPEAEPSEHASEPHAGDELMETGESAPPPFAQQDAGTASFEVRGRAIDYSASETAVASRAFRIVDARGVTTNGVTDAKGAFHVTGVVAPYDVRIDSSSGTDAPVLYLGLTSKSPVLRASASGGAIPAQAKHTIKVTLQVPSCNTSYCQALIATSSPNGKSGLSAGYPTGMTLINHDVTHGFIATGGYEPLTMHVLVQDAGSSWFRYAAWSTAAIAGGTSNTGTITPTVIPMRGAMTIGVQATGLPVAWRRSLSTHITFPGGGSSQLAGVESDSLVQNLPDVAGATVTAQTWISDRASETDPSFERRTNAWSGPQALSATQVTLKPTLPPEVIGVTHGGTLSAGSQEFAWTATSSALSQFVLIDKSKGVVFSAWTNASSISFAKLVALGVPLVTGSMSLSLTTFPGGDLATVTSDDPAIRVPFYDWSKPGSAAMRRLSFTLSN